MRRFTSLYTMGKWLIKPLILLGTLNIGFTLLKSDSVTAGNLYNNWNYASDPSYDSLAVGNSNIFNLGGTAVKVDNSYVWVAINGNLPINGLFTGSYYGGYQVANQNIGYGDFFFDFGNSNFVNASNSSSLFAIKFAANNDSAAAAIGIYANVRAKSVVGSNAGYWNPGSNRNTVKARTGLDPTTGEFAWNDPYYSYPSSSFFYPNVIASGNKIGDINLLNASELANAGFEGSSFGFSGSNTFGFKFDRNLVPDGNYVATLILECLNDMTGLRGSKMPPEVIVNPPIDSKPAPVPGMLIGMFVASGVLGKRAFKKKAAKAS